VQPLKPEEVSAKIEKLLPDFEDASKFVPTANEFVNLFFRGVSKDTSSKFFEVLQKLSSLIGNAEYNSLALSKIYDSAFTKRTVFSTEENESITKWKTELDSLKPKPTAPVFGKRPLESDQQQDAKRQRTSPNVESILLKLDTLEMEVSKLREELAQTKKDHNKEISLLRAELGLQSHPEEEDVPVANNNTDHVQEGAATEEVAVHTEGEDAVIEDAPAVEGESVSAEVESASAEGESVHAEGESASAEGGSAAAAAAEDEETSGDDLNA